MAAEPGPFMVYNNEKSLIVNVSWMAMIIINYSLKSNKWYLINNQDL